MLISYNLNLRYPLSNKDWVNQKLILLNHYVIQSFVFAPHLDFLLVVMDVVVHHLEQLFLCHNLWFVAELFFLSLKVLNVRGNNMAVEYILHLNQSLFYIPSFVMVFAPHCEKLWVKLLVEPFVSLN